VRPVTEVAELKPVQAQESPPRDEAIRAATEMPQTATGVVEPIVQPFETKPEAIREPRREAIREDLATPARTEAKPEVMREAIPDALTEAKVEVTREAAPDPPRRATPVHPQVASGVAGGVSRGRSELDANYLGRVAAHLARHKRFPAAARRRGARGNAVISFAIDPGGRVVSVSLVRSSGHTILDREAQNMVWRASPFPIAPDQRPQSFSVPVSFSIR
jgi:protein TonB